MSALIFNGYGNGAGARRKTRKWQSHGARSALVTIGSRRGVPQAGLPLRLPAATNGRRKKAVSELVLCAALVVAAHGATVFFLSAGRQANIAAPPRTPLIEIEIVRPKPLPQTLAPVPAPPVPRKPEPAVPRVARPVPPKSVPTPRPASETTPTTAAAVTAATAADAAPTLAPAPAPAPSAAASAPTERVTQPRGNAAYLNNPAPKYPPVARSRGWEGQVILNVHVLANGRPDSVGVAQSSGRTTLDEAAAKAVAEWLFVPAKRGQTAIDGWVQVPIDFNLGK